MKNLLQVSTQSYKPLFDIINFIIETCDKKQQRKIRLKLLQLVDTDSDEEINETNKNSSKKDDKSSGESEMNESK